MVTGKEGGYVILLHIVWKYTCRKKDRVMGLSYRPFLPHSQPSQDPVLPGIRVVFVLVNGEACLSDFCLDR